MQVGKGVDSLHLNDHLVADDQVQSVRLIQSRIAVDDGQRRLAPQ